MSENISFYQKDSDVNFHVVKEDDGLIRTYIETDKRLGETMDEQLKIYEKITGKALSELTGYEADEEIREYAKNVILEAGKIAEALKNAAYKDFSYESANCGTVFITPCAYGDVNSIDDVEYYLTNDEVVDSSESIYTLASNIVQYNVLKKELESEKDRLYDFYVKNVRPIEDIPREDLTDDEKGTMSFYSDWHKDIYRHRPRTGQDECKKQYEAREEEREM